MQDKNGLLVFSDTRPVIYAQARKPVIYPPVGERSAPIPPFIPEKTGTPTIPIKRYISTAKEPLFLPSTNAETKIPNVCKVNGTAKGIIIYEHIIIIAVKKAILVKSLIFIAKLYYIFSIQSTEVKYDNIRNDKRKRRH